MISNFIKWALKNRVVVLLIAAAVTGYGFYSINNTKVDAIPDLSENQVIFWYTLDAPSTDLGELRALQDWCIKFALQTVPGVSEVASYGGFKNSTRL